MEPRQTLPVLPLRGTAIFPEVTVPIGVGRPGTLRAVEAALKGDRLVFAVALRDGSDEPQPEQLYHMGVIARIGQVQRGLGGVQLLLQREQRATALQYVNGEGYLSAVVMDIEMPDVDGIQATRAILAAAPDLPIVAISGFDYEERVLEIRRAGARDYVRKSCVPDHLCEALAALLDA